MKNTILNTRASSYRYHLYKIYLELRYPDKLAPLTLRNRDQRSYKDKDIPKEERGVSLTTTSSTDDEMVVISILRYLFIGSIILSFIVIKGIPFVDYSVFGYVLFFIN